jgi:glutamate-1-semialdehyde 2,1-aminomutase
VPAALADLTLTVPYNDLAAVEHCFDRHGDSIAAIIVEPVAGNMNCIPPVAGFLEGLRQCCNHHGSVLIFDEVMTGFRVARGGAQRLYGVTPDLSTFGKVIGGGMPVGAFGGKQSLMEQIAPTGPVYQAGTLSGNPVAMAAGLASLELISERGFFYNLAKRTHKLTHGLEGAAADAGVPVRTTAVGGMFGLFFTDQDAIINFEQVSRCDIDAFKVFFHQMLDRGVYLAPSAYEAGFVSAAHTEEHIEATIAAARESFSQI